jgi:type II secretory pathway component PulF
MRSSVIAAAVAVILHVLLGAALLYVLVFMVPGYKREFRDYQNAIELPYYTEMVVAISDWFAAYWYVVVIVAIPLLALDGGVVFLCWQRRGTRILGVLWILLLVLLWLLIMAVVILGIWLVHLKLMQSLAR